jgi:hypothetical protein
VGTASVRVRGNHRGTSFGSGGVFEDVKRFNTEGAEESQRKIGERQRRLPQRSRGRGERQRQESSFARVRGLRMTAQGATATEPAANALRRTGKIDCLCHENRAGETPALRRPPLATWNLCGGHGMPFPYTRNQNQQHERPTANPAGADTSAPAAANHHNQSATSGGEPVPCSAP